MVPIVMTSIIILTYNSDKYIKKLVDSIYEFNSENEFEIIVADNGSNDTTVEEVKKLKKRVKFIDNGQNLGFAAGINAASKYAKGEYLLLMNPDCVWEKGEINEMVSVFDNNLGVGIVGGKMIGENGKEELSAGNFLGMSASFLMAFGLDELFRVRFSPKKIVKVDFVSGGFMMIRKDVFEKLSGFDENLFMYVEDMELCYRAKLANFSTYFAAIVAVNHAGHGSSSRTFSVKNIVKGLLYFHKKHGTMFSYNSIKLLFKAKALLLVLIGKILNNKYLVTTYSEVIKI